MKRLQCCGCIISLLLLALTVACAPVKTLNVWKDEAYTQRLEKVLIISVTKRDYIRKQVENSLSNQLNSRGIEAIPSYKFLQEKAGKEVSRDEVLKIVRELGVDHVLVARAIQKKSIVNHQPNGAFFAASAVYNDGWYTYYVGSVVYPESEYDTDYYTISTNLFDVQSKKPVWADLSRVKVSNNSGQAAINLLIPILIKHMEDSQLIE